MNTASPGGAAGLSGGGGGGLGVSLSGLGRGVHMVPGGITMWGIVFLFVASSPVLVA